MKKISDLNYCELIIIQTRKEAKQIAKLIRKDGEKAYSKRILKPHWEYPYYLRPASLDIFDFACNTTIHPVSDFVKPSKIDEAFDELASFDSRIHDAEYKIEKIQEMLNQKVSKQVTGRGQEVYFITPNGCGSTDSSSRFSQTLGESITINEIDKYIRVTERGKLSCNHSTDLRDLKPKSKSIHESGLLFEPAKELEVLPEKWCVKVNEEIMQMFDYVYPRGYHHSDIVSSNNWKSNAEEGYTEISFNDFKRLVLDKEAKPKLEKNHWYKSNNHQHVLVYYSTDENENYHFDIDGVFSIRCAPPRYDNSWRLATESEVENYFITEAKRRGFKPNQNIITPNGNKRNTGIGEFKYHSNRNAFSCGRYGIFYDGKWAEIIDITKPAKSERSILEEAESKGFKTGCYIDNTTLGLRFKGIHNDTSIFDYDGQTLTMGAKKKIIYRNGVWAKCGRIEFN